MSRHNIVAALVLFAAYPSQRSGVKTGIAGCLGSISGRREGEHAGAREGKFLWADESHERLGRIRNGEVVVSPLGHTPHSGPGRADPSLDRCGVHSRRAPGRRDRGGSQL